jgi:quinohemoprotein ethanol dehydrogenase
MFAAAENKLPPNGRFMAFKLGAKASLPAPTLELTYGDPPPPTTHDEATLARGERLFREHCLRCHQGKGASNRHIPDLRRMPRAMYDSFESIVHDGAAQSLGMPAFGHVLSKPQVGEIKAYLLVEAERDRALRAQAPFWVELKLGFFRLVARVLRALL